MPRPDEVILSKVDWRGVRYSPARGAMSGAAAVSARAFRLRTDGTDIIGTW